MKIVQLKDTTRTFVVNEGQIIEVPFQILPLEEFYRLGYLVHPETYAEKKERELREGFEACSIGQIEEHLRLLSRFSHEYQVAASVLEKKIERFDRQQLEDATEANAHVSTNPVPRPASWRR